MKKLQKEVFQELLEYKDLPTCTLEELSTHTNPSSSAWVLIDGIVYDVTKFLKFHPGGESVLLRACGKDASADFRMVHHPSILKKPHYKKFAVARIAGLPSAEEKKVFAKKVQDKWLPYSDHYWLDPSGQLSSPHFTKKHYQWQAKLRDFVNRELLPFTGKWDEAKQYPKEIYKKMYQEGVFAAGWPAEYGGTVPEGGWDEFMKLIAVYEFARCGSGGFVANVFIKGIGLPPVLAHGSKALKDEIARPVIQGEKVIALAITEPWGGSDVANIRTTATLTTESNGEEFYLVTGEKKFITGGMDAHYFTTAVRTDPNSQGMKGISLLVIDATAPGVTRQRMNMQGWWASTTTYITFDKVKVPKSRLLGKEGSGFTYIMENFNGERFGVCCTTAASIQFCIAESIRFARDRYTFGKRLIDHQVIRGKLGQMAMRSEAVYAWLEQLCYHMSKGASHVVLASRLALLKVFATQQFEFVAREASQIFGGNSFMRGGPGEQVERLYREVRVLAIGGGSEEVMTDFAMRASKL